ncbi:MULTISPECIES: CRISPR-associated helicase Cas3' [Nocardia]|uniref:CRISPR-associated helicase Cas3' n=1 Tax=Nocardia TaxID=1817 RepID=UPI00265A0784|nr:CRISPR-associated helicase Cas3' [Nocardia sp. PE-7]WKG08909.1 CRISPR-associated helicase Cas3' [Nocardia sp. PE-7]
MADRGLVDLRLWGKSKGLPTVYPLMCHLLDTGAAVGVLWDQWLSRGLRRFIARGLGVDEVQARALVVWWAGLHDIGKAMSCFQSLDAGAYSVSAQEYPPGAGDYRSHEYASHAWLVSALTGHGFARRPARMVAQLLGGHHGCFFEADSRVWATPLAFVLELGGGEWERQRLLMVDTVRRCAGSPAPVAAIDPAAAAVISGFVVLADWLVSQEEFLKQQLGDLPSDGTQEQLHAYFDRVQARIPALLEEAGLGRLSLQPGDFEAEHGFAPNALQASVQERLPALMKSGGGLLVVAAPTGIGKTELALSAARAMGEAAGASGFVFGLPTMSTANHIYDRLTEYGQRRVSGRASLALLHSMAWMHDAYGPAEIGDDVVTGEGVLGDPLAVTEWLIRAYRGLLAPWATGTIDQALMAGVRVRYNMFRLLGLAGKVFVVDEVHAYDAYMQRLLCGLLTWLGRIGAPVVLLSATLPTAVGQRLVRAYLAGAGHRTGADLEGCPYPGWLYADAETGVVSRVSVPTPVSTLWLRPHRVPVRQGRVVREQALRELLDGLVETRSGCVAVICNTVADTQITYQALRRWFETEFGSQGPRLWTLHARFPVDRRDELTEEVVAAYGKSGARPWGVVVATQVIEQSIDLDFDLVISDLAPLALLLQRAGRGQRHPRQGRPDWALGKRLEVLIPTGAEGLAIPGGWPFVYPISLLERTATLLAADLEVEIPSHVQGLMEQVYDESFADGTPSASDLDRISDERLARAVAEQVGIPAPGGLVELSPLTFADLDPEVYSTRLGADSGRVVCCYTDSVGAQWLDPECTVALPVPFHGRDRLTPAQVKAVLAKSIPVPGTWTRNLAVTNQPPAGWSKHPLLRRIALLTATGPAAAMQLGARECILDQDLGLVEIRHLIRS